MSTLSRPKSTEIYERLCEVIPGGVNSPIRSCKSMNQLPLVADRGHADLLYDADGHAYIDYCGSWGALIHGHSHPQIVQAAQQRVALGSTFGITTKIEEELARYIVNLIDSIDKIRFVSSGTEATMSAIRLARGFTKRETIIKFSGNYHGHADFFLVQAGSGVASLPQSSSAGIPEEMVRNTFCLPYNDTEMCRQVLRDPKNKGRFAAVILEPVAGNMGVVPAKQEFIDMLREETAATGTLLIFDEVITGFRVGLKGAQGLYGVKPDLTTFGKIIGGGFPAAAFGGRRDIMDCLSPLGSIYQAGTLSGNPVAMEAGLQALKMLNQKGFYEELLRKTNLLTQPIKDYLKKSGKNVCIQQVGSMFTLFFGLREVNSFEDTKHLDNESFARFFRMLFSQGVYIPPLHIEAWFVSTAHKDEHLIKTRDLILSYLEREF
jgi:glutamate-1-semialdehyde 2,1-aminomutase